MIEVYIYIQNNCYDIICRSSCFIIVLVIYQRGQRRIKLWQKQKEGMQYGIYLHVDGELVRFVEVLELNCYIPVPNLMVLW